MFYFTNNIELFFIGIATGWLLFVRSAVLRSIISRLTSPADQGTVFAVVACAESISGMCGTLIANSVYSATVESYRGAVWLVEFGMEVISLIVFGYVYFINFTFIL